MRARDTRTNRFGSLPPFRRLETPDYVCELNGSLVVSLDDGTSYELPMTAQSCRMADLSEKVIQGGAG